ncbi:MAG: hypothetical protein IPK24_17400 [Kineosporiaceae bacterium]|nr:hypothetical protein [Kineosporiaceae bacterium]
MDVVPDEEQTLTHAVTRLHRSVQSVQLAPEAPALAGMRARRERALRLLESYALPRLADVEPPLIVVIGGPTGAGKSTLTNSLVGAPVSLSGVLRPTTRQPVMVYNPLDTEALQAVGLVGGGTENQRADAARWVDLRAVPHPDVARGLAVIDSPDLDSRVDHNRDLASRLLAVADMWLFVTTGTDYADALSWGVLAEAAERKVPLAVLLNRLRDNEAMQVRRHLATLLTQAGLAHARMFTLPEMMLIEGRLAVQAILPLQRWLETASRATDRHGPAAPVFDSSVEQAVAAVHALADAADDQVVAARRLRVDVESIFAHAREQVRQRCTDASLVTEDLARAWQLARGPARGPNNPAHAAPPSGGLLRRRSRATQRPQDGVVKVAETLHSAISALLHEQVDLALFRITERWADHPSITPAQAQDLARPTGDFARRVDDAVLGWLTGIHARVHAGETPVPPSSPEVARADPVTVAVATLAVEGGPARGSAGVRQEVHTAARRPLAHLTEPQIAALARESWLDLVAAVNAVILHDEARLSNMFDESQVLPEVAALLREAADTVTAALHRPEPA